jgi:hypothetical protein
MRRPRRTQPQAVPATESAPLPDPSPEPQPPTAHGPHVNWAVPGTAPIRRSWNPPAVASPAPLKPLGIRNVRILVGLERASSIAGYYSSSRPEHGPDVVTHGVEASVIGEAAQEPLAPLVFAAPGLRRAGHGGGLGRTFVQLRRTQRRASAGDTKQSLPSSESVLLWTAAGLVENFVRPRCAVAAGRANLGAARH